MGRTTGTQDRQRGTRQGLGTVKEAGGWDPGKGKTRTIALMPTVERPRFCRPVGASAGASRGPARLAADADAKAAAEAAAAEAAAAEADAAEAEAAAEAAADVEAGVGARSGTRGRAAGAEGAASPASEAAGVRRAAARDGGSALAVVFGGSSNGLGTYPTTSADACAHHERMHAPGSAPPSPV